MRKQYQPVSAAEAVKVIKSGDHVHISSVSSVPQCLVKALCDRGRAGELKNVYIHHLHTEGAAPYVNPEFEGIFQHNAFFVGANVRESAQSSSSPSLIRNIRKNSTRRHSNASDRIIIIFVEII